MSPDKLGTGHDIAAAYGTTIGYVRKMASLHYWRKVRHGGRTYYHWDDAGKSLGK